jgi:hypothetical protein
VRYCIASLRCLGAMSSASSKSAIVRATFRMRSCALAESPSRVIAFSSCFSPSTEMTLCFRNIFGNICAFEYVFFSPRYLSSWRSRAAITRRRTVAESFDKVTCEPQGHRQIKSGSLLAHVRGRQVDSPPDHAEIQIHNSATRT